MMMRPYYKKMTMNPFLFLTVRSILFSPSSRYSSHSSSTAFTFALDNPTFPNKSSASAPSSLKSSTLSMIGGDLSTNQQQQQQQKEKEKESKKTLNINITPLKNVVVVGGTHGNEYTGIWVIKSLEAKQKSEKKKKEEEDNKHSSLSISTLLANPQAYMENKRFISHDLNRQFTKDALLAKCQDDGNVNDDEEYNNNNNHNILEECDVDGLPKSVESLRAREIDLLLGPKFIQHDNNDTSNNNKIPNDGTAADVVIDLHTTTTNMGVTIIVAEGDSIMTRAAAYVLQKHRTNNINKEDDTKWQCVLHTHPSRDTRPNVASTARHGFTIEVGPVPQGVLRHDAVEQTEEALESVLEYLHLYNTDREKLDDILRDAYSVEVVEDDERCIDMGESKASASSCNDQSRRRIVPCYKSAKAKKEGEMSGKITWPSVSDNPNFPALMVHKNLQDQDFELIRKGDPLFVDLEGNIIPYDGSHGSPVYLIFVNEGGYYYKSSGTGIAVAVKTFFDLETGLLVTRTSDEGYEGDEDGL